MPSDGAFLHTPSDGRQPTKKKRRSSLGVIDTHLKAYQRQQQTNASLCDSANQEITLSQARNKALERLGASEQAGGVAHAYAPRGGRSHYRQPLLPQTFADPEMEDEYRQTAFIMHRPFVCWLLIACAVAYGAIAVRNVAVATLLSSSQSAVDERNGFAAALRGLAALACLLCAALVLSNRVALAAVQFSAAVTLFLLWAAPLAAAFLRGVPHEPPELLLLVFASYGVLCPAIHVRFLLLVNVTLSVAHALILPLCHAGPATPHDLSCGTYDSEAAAADASQWLLLLHGGHRYCCSAAATATVRQTLDASTRLGMDAAAAAASCGRA